MCTGSGDALHGTSGTTVAATVAAASSPQNDGYQRQDITLPPIPITSDGAGRNILDRGKRWACRSPNDYHLDFGTLRTPDDDGLQRRDLNPTL